MVNLTRGDIVLCDLNPVIGTEQSGIRPVVIVQSDRANKVSPHTIIAPFTTKIHQSYYFHHRLSHVLILLLALDWHSPFTAAYKNVHFAHR